MIMKIRHAAALALVGWHLMIPSVSPTAALIAAPLSQWNRWASYDSVDNCDSAMVELKNEAFSQAQYDCLADHSRADLCHGDLAKSSSECVSADDPRLKDE